MEASEAMQVLVRNGQGDEAREIVEKASEAAHRVYALIKEDDTRTPDYHDAQIQAHYEAARSQVTEKLVSMAKKARDAESRDAIRLFGTEGLTGDAASLVISRRDAADRVAAIETRQQLRETLDRATRTGDEVLARAIAERAMENRDLETLNKFLETRPHLDEAAQRIWDSAQSEDINSSFGAAFALFALRPPETSRR